MSYMNHNWLYPLTLELSQKSPQSWSVSENDSAHGLGQTPQVEWRKNGYVKGRRAWVIHDDYNRYVLLFSLIVKDGAVKGSQGIRPVLILTDENGDVLYKKLFKKPHNKADVKFDSFQYKRSGQLQYRLQPHISDLVEAFLSPWNNLMETLFKVDDVPMLGLEVFEEYGYPSVKPMQKVVRNGDIELIDRKHVVEILGTPFKKAMAIKVAKLAMEKAMAIRVAKLVAKRASKDFYEVTIDTTLKGSWVDSFTSSYPKTFDISSERDLEEIVEEEYEKYAKGLWGSQPFDPKKIIFDKMGVFGLRFVMRTTGYSLPSFTISIHSKQVSDEDLLQILKHGTFFSHALRRY